MPMTNTDAAKRNVRHLENVASLLSALSAAEARAEKAERAVANVEQIAAEWEKLDDPVSRIAASDIREAIARAKAGGSDA